MQNFLLNGWYAAALQDEITDKPLARRLLNEPIVFFRDPNGNFAALEDRCCHRGAPLSVGWCSERGITCGYHGMEFDTTGACVHIPGHKGTIPQRARVRSYPVVTRGDLVWIWMGDPSRAEADLAVNYPPAESSAWRTTRRFRCESSYLFVIENLMDLSHLSWVHRNSIGSAPEDSAGAEMQVKGTPTGIRFQRTMLNAQPSKKVAMSYGFPGNIDRWSDFEYVMPGNVIQWTGAVAAGDYEKGVREGGMSLKILHSVTPETETSCHYFFCRTEGLDGLTDEARQDQAAAQSLEPIGEDIAILELQQQRLIGYDMNKLIDIPSDVVRAPMVRGLRKKIEEEQAALAAAAG